MTSDLSQHNITEEASSAFAIVYDHLALNHTPEPSDVIFCFGSRDPSAASHAARLFGAGMAPVVMVSGGGRMSDGMTEAAPIEVTLVERGVPRDPIITEHISSHTGETVRFGLAQLRLHHGLVGSVLSIA